MALNVLKVPKLAQNNKQTCMQQISNRVVPRPLFSAISNEESHVKRQCVCFSALAEAGTSQSSTSMASQGIPQASSPPPLVPLQFPDEYYDAEGRIQLKCLTLPELEEWCLSIGEAKQRAMHIWRWIYYDRNWLRDLDEAPAGEVQNGFSERFRAKIRDIATIDGGLQVQKMYAAADGTRKLVFSLTSGPGAGGQVETVLIPIVRETGSKARITLCVSSQVGCAQGCTFCYTGKMGLLGSLTPAQIVEQVVVARRLLFEEDSVKGVKYHVTPITNIVFMGMGEPMDCLHSVMPSIDIMTQPLGLHLSANKITVSTVGLVTEMRRFCQETKAVLAVSLHATTDESRNKIIPTNRRHDLHELITALEELFPKDKAAPRHGHHVLIEYTMLAGVNDSPEDAARLISLMKNVRCKINLIVFNPHEGTAFQPSSPEAVQVFRSVLIQGGHVATVRASRGDDQMAACGQLGDPDLAKKVRKEQRQSEVTPTGAVV